MQDHGLEAGLDIHLIPQCASALPEDPKTHPPQPVYLEMPVVNTNRYLCCEVHGCLFGQLCAVYPRLWSDCCGVSQARSWHSYGNVLASNGKLVALNGNFMASNSNFMAPNGKVIA